MFEYIRTGIPIIGIGPTEGDASQILEQTNSGRMFDYFDRLSIINFIKEKRKISGINIEDYSRKRQTQILAEEFQKYIDD